MEKRVRCTLDCSPEFIGVVDEIAAENGCVPRSEVIRRAVGLYKLIRDRSLAGDRIIIRSASGMKERELVARW